MSSTATNDYEFDLALIFGGLGFASKSKRLKSDCRKLTQKTMDVWEELISLGETSTCRRKQELLNELSELQGDVCEKVKSAMRWG